jgi:hypothetical protein
MLSTRLNTSKYENIIKLNYSKTTEADQTAPKLTATVTETREN